MATLYFKPLALASIAFLAVQTKATYLFITDGTCVSHGYQYIDDVTECRSAGQQLGLNVVPYGIFDGSNSVRGCFYGTNLAFNSNQASTTSCDATCICKMGTVIITAGTCVSHGYEYIDDVTECRRAGQQLGFNVVPYVVDDHGLGHPRGCFYGTNLAFNSNQDTTRSCDDTCICKLGTESTSTATTTLVIATQPMTTTTALVPTTTMTTLALKATTTIKETTKFLPPKTTLTSTTSVPSSSCSYAVRANTAVKGQGSGGKKLKRASYRFEAAYLDACKASCNGDSKCMGFVDDPTDRRGRMCKPKKTITGYHKRKKAFHVKGTGC